MSSRSSNSSDKIQQATGLIETIGYPAAIEAADACTKTANVELAGLEPVGSGLVTIVIQGDISAVHEAVRAGVAAASRVGRVVSSHVIGRPSVDMGKLFWNSSTFHSNNVTSDSKTCTKGDKEDQVSDKKLTDVNVFNASEVDTLCTDHLVSQETLSNVVIGDVKDEEPSFAEPRKPCHINVDIKQLRKCRTVKLRSMARQLPEFEMSKNQIKFAKKEELIRAIVAWYKASK